jgi:hypothetical protein
MNLLVRTAAVLVLTAAPYKAEIVCMKEPKLKPIRCICGTLVDAIGGPIAGATVSVARDGGNVVRVRTANDGRFLFAGLKPGTYDVLVAEPGFRRFQSSIVVAAPGRKCSRGLVILLDTNGLESCGSRLFKVTRGYGKPDHLLDRRWRP